MLNDAVRKEIASSLQYMYFHVHLEDAGYEYLSRYLHKVSIAEMRHIEMLAERIMFWEGDVDMNPHEPTRQITEVGDMLNFAIKIERSTIDSYSEYSRIAAGAGHASHVSESGGRRGGASRQFPHRVAESEGLRRTLPLHAVGGPKQGDREEIGAFRRRRVAHTADNRYICKSARTETCTGACCLYTVNASLR